MKSLFCKVVHSLSKSKLFNIKQEENMSASSSDLHNIAPTTKIADQKRLLIGNCIDVIAVKSRDESCSVKTTPFFVRFPKKSTVNQSVQVFVKSYDAKTDLTAEHYRSSTKRGQETLIATMTIESGFKIPFFDQKVFGGKISDMMKEMKKETKELSKDLGDELKPVEEDLKEQEKIQRWEQQIAEHADQDIESEDLDHDAPQLNIASILEEVKKENGLNSSPIEGEEFEYFQHATQEEMNEFYKHYNSLKTPKEKIKYLKEMTKKRRDEKQEEEEKLKKRDMLKHFAGEMALSMGFGSFSDSTTPSIHTSSTNSMHHDISSPVTPVSDDESSSPSTLTPETPTQKKGLKHRLSSFKQKLKKSNTPSTPSETNEEKSSRRERLKKKVLKNIHDELLYPHEWFIPAGSHLKAIETELNKFYEKGETKLTLIFKTKVLEQQLPEFSMFGSNIAKVAGAKQKESSGTNKEQLALGRLYLWKDTDKIIVSDIDGTITKSDLGGHVACRIGKDYVHKDITEAYSEIHQAGYKMLYLTARPITMSSSTRFFIERLQQKYSKNGKSVDLPEGAVFTAYNSGGNALVREIVLKRPDTFKIYMLDIVLKTFVPGLLSTTTEQRHEALKKVTPFYSGFGNRATDDVAMSQLGIAPERSKFYSFIF